MIIKKNELIKLSLQYLDTYSQDISKTQLHTKKQLIRDTVNVLYRVGGEVENEHNQLGERFIFETLDKKLLESTPLDRIIWLSILKAFNKILHEKTKELTDTYEDSTQLILDYLADESDLEKFYQYERVRRTGSYNMITEAEYAADDAELSIEEYLYVMKNYAKIRERIIDKYGTVDKFLSEFNTRTDC